MSRPTNPTIHVPKPRRPGTFSLTPIATDSSSTHDHSPLDEQSTPSTPDVRDPPLEATQDANSDAAGPPNKSRSILNLTSSTLFGIYNYSGFDSNRDEPPTPFGPGTMTPAPGNGSQTPVRSSSIDIRGFLPRSGPTFSEELVKERAEISRERKRERRKSEMQSHNIMMRKRSSASHYILVALRTAVLFAIGMGYGAFIAHVHDSGQLSPVKVEPLNRGSWLYVAFWGAMAATLGNLMPLFDFWWPQAGSSLSGAYEAEDVSKEATNEGEKTQFTLGAEWNPLVRSVGAFVGIAFAIRKLTWQSTLQVSITLALVNPFLWYILDRTRTGFSMAAVTGIAGAAILLAINPDWVPSPAKMQPPAVPEKATIWSMLQSVTKPSPAAQPVVPQIPADDFLSQSLSYESVGVATWIASVLFCSSIFFGSIGRRLSLDRLI